MWEDKAILKRCNPKPVGGTERMVLCCGNNCPETETVPLDNGVMCKWCLAGEVPSRIRIHTTRESYEKAIYDG